MMSLNKRLEKIETIQAEFAELLNSFNSIPKIPTKDISWENNLIKIELNTDEIKLIAAGFRCLVKSEAVKVNLKYHQLTLREGDIAELLEMINATDP